MVRFVRVRQAGSAARWNTVGAEVTVDLSQYLETVQGQPLRQTNTIVFGASQLSDVEAELRSLVTANSLLAA